MEKLRTEKLTTSEKSLEQLRREADEYERQAEMYEAQLNSARTPKTEEIFRSLEEAVAEIGKKYEETEEISQPKRR